jgi:ABC-type bacteriocin/lantibiotic exporter with double-glycine peptidase domain
MPTLSRFYGMVIFMNYNDHQPPHFHARYQDQEVLVEIDTGVVQGKMTKRALQMIFEWTEKYHNELRRNWDLARARKSLEPIPPLS